MNPLYTLFQSLNVRYVTLGCSILLICLCTAGLYAETRSLTGISSGSTPVKHPVTIIADPVSGSSVALTMTGVLIRNITGPDSIANPGDQVTYTFGIFNNGSALLTNLMISDPSAVVTGGPLASLAPGVLNTTTFTAVHTLSQADIDGGQFTTTATVTATPPSGPDVTAQASDTQTILRLASLDLIKSGTPDFGPDELAQAGEAIYYSFLVINTGNVTLTGVNIADSMVTVTGGTIDSLPPDIPVYTAFYANYTLTQEDINAGTVVNMATVSGYDPSNNLIWHSDEHIQPLDQVMKIDMEKIGTPNFGPDGIPQAGETISYNFLITNTSNVTLTSVEVHDPLILLSGSPIASMLPGAVDFSSFAGNHALSQDDIDAGVFTNTAGVTAFDPNNLVVSHNDLHTQPLTRVSAISFTVAGQLDMDGIFPVGIANAGDVVNYVYRISNAGNTTLTDIQVSDPSAIISGGVIASLAPGATDSVTITGIHTLSQSDIDAGFFTCLATVTATPPAGADITASAGDTRTIARISSLDMIKSGTPDFGPDEIAQEGEFIHYSFLLVNTGNVTLTDVSITDPLTVVTGGPINTMPPDVPFYTTFTASYVLTQDDINAGSLTNTATVSGHDPQNQQVSHSDEHIQPLGQVMRIDMEKIGVPDFGPDGIPQAGETISYHFLITNTSNVTLTNVMVNDPLIVLSGGPIASFLPGAVDQETFTGTHILTQADIDLGHYINVATVTALDPASNIVSHTDRHIQGLVAPSWVLTKSSIETTFHEAGEVLHYSIVLDNTGNVPVGAVAISDPGADSGSLAYTGGDVNADNILDPSETWTFTASHAITFEDVTAGHYLNTATASGNPLAGSLENAIGSADVTACTPVMVAVTIAASANPVVTGTPVTFTATPVNGGGAPVYQWKVNGTVVGSNLPTLSYVPFNYDVVSCVLTSELSCTVNNPAVSNTVEMTVTGTPSTLPVAGSVPGGAVRCYNAIESITVAGGVSTFTVSSGAEVTMIAGERIHFLPGTNVVAGAHLHGYISTGFCNEKSSAIVATATDNGSEPLMPTDGALKLYPNPTSGSFTLEQTGSSSTTGLSFEIYTITGEKIAAAEMAGEAKHRFNMPGIPDGIYLVRFRNGGNVQSLKLLLRR